MKNCFEKKNDINIMKYISCAIEHFLRFLRDFRSRYNKNELNRASVVVTNVFELTFSEMREKGEGEKPNAVSRTYTKKEENNGSHFINHFLNLIRNVCFRGKYEETSMCTCVPLKICVR